MTPTDAEIEALLAHPVANQLLFGAEGANELSIVWDEHPEAGKLRCKARLDRLTVFEQWATIVDLKKLEDASPKWIGFRIGDYRYDLQAAMYRRACAALASRGRASQPSLWEAKR